MPAATFTERVLRYDRSALMGVRRWHAPPLTRVMRVITHLGDGPTWGFVGLVLAASGGDGIEHAKRLGVAAIAATGIAQLLKRWLRRPRPSALAGFTALADDPDAFSFPSGHSAAAFASAVALAGSGAGLGPLLLGFACLIGVSRVYLGAHYPLDVAAGALIGVSCGAAARVVLG